MECVPTARVDVVNVALQLLRVHVPHTVLTSLLLDALPILSNIIGIFVLSDSNKQALCCRFVDNAGYYRINQGLTVCVNAGDVLPTKFVSPPYTTVIECVPTARVDVV